MPRQKRTGAFAGKSKGQLLELPHGWDPYAWQDEVLKDLKSDAHQYYDLTVHRRAGKDQLALNMIAIASQKRVGQYWHVYPYEKQCRTHIWMGADKETGIRFIDQAFPHAMRKATRNQAMEIEFTNGSIFKLMGSDNFEALRGGEPLFISFSEAAFAHPNAWSNVRPIMRRNKGKVVFITTPNGPNWYYRQHEVIKNNPNWYVRVLTVDDTKDNDGKPIFSKEDIDAERKDGTSEDEIRREYYCDFHTGAAGAYYVDELNTMRNEGRIRQVDYDPKRPVYAAFDLGTSDLTVVVFMQKKGNAHYCIGHRAWSGADLFNVMDEIKMDFPWPIEKYVMPHDLATGMARAVMVQALAKYGEVEILERGNVVPGIQLVRTMLSTLWVDNAVRQWGDNDTLLEALATYRSKEIKTTEAQRKVRSSTPHHDWSSHYADALRYYAVAEQLGALSTASQWGPAPNYATHDRIAKTSG